ncbi:FAD:protein FMN transferase [Acetanaerobacterium elongatum]|uniref:FAD:protein FMN transferase n=1 Tax=Acetanaerobacterium elongatum TaxID=258515 RepID=A0A1H0F1P0_9FIRM|nr:FAD:protein FMN transferase [Acetanaerobacterium elongatum]SDN88521.1 thiamine biosynthesis lipoprotein [Acetanaerobacterium elongatum]
MNKLISISKGTVTCRFEALGTINEITVFGGFGQTLLEEAAEWVMQINNRMSPFIPVSDIARLNHNAGLKPVTVHLETLQLLRKAKQMSELSNGAFDITVRPLIELWGIGKKQNYIPSKREINKAMRLTGSKDLILDEQAGTAYLKRKGQAADLGGIAKGYAADEVKRILTESGVTGAIINLGGNISTIGFRPDGAPWYIGIQNPLAVTGEYLGRITCKDDTVVTSGSNERFFMKDGIRYHHIIDPRTGEPAQSGLLGVTAVCKSSAEADALTTAAFVLGMERGVKLIEQFKAEAVFLTEDYKVYTTNGLTNRFELVPLLQRKAQ